ncbi:MAG: hypothetical protein CME59_10110 [Halioglobus sp.]|nr:hypothetical protein [Halioglobus sp.]
MAESNDPDNTEVSAPGDDDATEAPSSDYTQFGGSDSATTSTGFEAARTLAEKAQREHGRLLKKRFVLEDELGAGGMGVVYKARDLRKVEAEDSNPYIAAKVLGASFRDHPHAFVSLQQEAVKSQKLAHPNIVTVHDFDRDGDTIFMTMELLKGDPLDNLLKLDAPFGKETCVRYFSELCAGLEYAHKRGLIHSDFKPGNIFVTTGGVVKILDFGIARAANRERSDDFDAGELGALTPAYATAEMVRREEPSFSDDVYALACVLYYMLSGKHPYQNRSAVEAEKQGLKPARPDNLSNREWQALSAALSTSKAKRPQTVEAFRSAFMPKKRALNLKTIAAVSLLVLAGAGWLGYQQYQLAGEREATLAGKLQAARDCFFRREYQCAVDNARVVLSLAPNQAEATTLLQTAQESLQQQARESRLATLLQEAEACLDSRDLACARLRAAEALDLDPDNLRTQQLVQAVEKARHNLVVGDFLGEARDCLQRNDPACAGIALDSAAAAGAEPAELYELRRSTDELAARLESERQALAARREQLLAQGQSCLDAGDFDCAKARAGAALEIDAADSGAIALQQATRVARQQRAADAATVARILQEAQDCYSARNYSCAIAKSESALAILPDSGEASAARQRALQAQKKAKRTIVIE